MTVSPANDAPTPASVDPASLLGAIVLSGTPTSVCGETAVLMRDGFPLVYARESALEPFRPIALARGHAVAIDEEGSERTVLIELADGDVWSLEGGYFQVQDLKALLARSDDDDSSVGSSSATSGGYSSGYAFTAYDPNRYGNSDASSSVSSGGYSSGYAFTAYDPNRYGSSQPAADGADDDDDQSSTVSKRLVSKRLESKRVTSRGVQSKKVASQRVGGDEGASQRVSSQRVSSKRVSSKQVTHQAAAGQSAGGNTSRPTSERKDAERASASSGTAASGPPSERGAAQGKNTSNDRGWRARYANRTESDSPYDHDHEGDPEAYDHDARPYADHENADSPYDLDAERSPYDLDLAQSPYDRRGPSNRRQRDRAPATTAAQPAPEHQVNAWELDADIKRILHEQGRFSAIQAYRQRTGAGLTEARSAVEALTDQPRVVGTSSISSPQNKQAMRFIWFVIGLSAFGWLMERCG